MDLPNWNDLVVNEWHDDLCWPISVNEYDITLDGRDKAIMTKLTEDMNFDAS